jgi:Dolichyl-phosphate-mannose-protein mannosyltransferase
MAYLGAASSLAEHGTLRVPSSQWDSGDSTSALTTWPPAFPAAMAIPRALGAGPLLSARIVTALSAFVTAAVLFLLFQGAVGTLAAVSGVATVFVTTAVVGVHLSVLSEPLFLASLVLTLLAMVRSDRKMTESDNASDGVRDWLRRPLVAGIPAALAAMTRYAGVCAPAAVVLWFFFRDNKPLQTRFADAAEAGAVPALVIVAWLIRSVRVGDSSGSPEVGLYGDFGLTLRETAHTFADWLAPGIHPPMVQLIVAIALAVGIVMVAVNGLRRCSAPARILLTADVLLLACYVFALLSARVLVGSAIPFDFRLLVPSILLAEVVIIVAAASYVAVAGKMIRPVIVTACALWFAASLAQSASDASEAITDGSDFASSTWESSPTLDWVKSRSAGHPLFSNWPAAIYFKTSRIARDTPQSLDTADLDEFGHILEKSHGALVAFSLLNPDYPPGDSIAHALGLVKVGQFSDGSVWLAPEARTR